MLRFCQLSTSITRFQHQTTPAQLLHKTPETLQSPEQGIARSPVILVAAHLHTGIQNMTSLAPPLPDVQSETRNLLPVKLAITLGLTALADWLFYDERIGISMTLFAIALFAGSWLGNLVGLNWRRTATAALVLFVGLVPAVEELNG